MSAPLPWILKANKHRDEVLGQLPGFFHVPRNHTRRKLILIHFTNRSGSNLLAELLQASGLGIYKGEVLNSDSIIKSHRDRGIENINDYLIDAFGADESIPVIIKASAPQFCMLNEYQYLKPTSLFKKTCLISISRRSVLDQAISFAIAIQTQKWRSDDESKISIEPSFDYKQICDLIEIIINDYRAFSRTCAFLGASPLTVYYEDLDTKDLQYDYLQEISNKISSVLDIENIPSDKIIQSFRNLPIQKQSNDLNKTWKEKFFYHITCSGK